MSRLLRRLADWLRKPATAGEAMGIVAAGFVAIGLGLMIVTMWFAP